MKEFEHSSEYIFLVAYDEIGLKGQNKSEFVNLFIDRLAQATGIYRSHIRHRQGRIYIDVPENRKDDIQHIEQALRRVFGLQWFSLANVCGMNYESLEEGAMKLAQKYKQKGAKSFKIESRRANKDFPLTSYDIQNKLGDRVRTGLDLEVDVHQPDIIVYVEVRHQYIYVHVNRENGPGGLPVGSNGRALMLLSGGIDSPVAAWQLMKRGLAVDFVYFHSPPFTGQKAMQKVRDLVEKLHEWSGGEGRLMVPWFTGIQEEIAEKVPSAYWTVLHRRYMHRIAAKLAEKEGIDALATGDSVGQVASQTLKNMRVIDNATDALVLQPLTGLDKNEIIRLARQIGTYRISTRPYEDCCVLFAPGNPSTQVKQELVEKYEERLDTEALVDTAIEKMETPEITPVGS